MRVALQTVGMITGIMLLARSQAGAQLTSPQVGWQAQLSKLAHNVSGRVSVVDDDTLQVDNFTYDGGGLSVFFYLGHTNTSAGFASGLKIGPQLLGTQFGGNGPALLIDLPSGETLNGWNAVAVWCVDVGVSFGSGTFASVSGPLAGDYNANGTVDAADYVVWRNMLGQSGTGLAADGDANNVIDSSDYGYWRARIGQTSGGSAALSPVPEPTTGLIAWSAIAPLLGFGAAMQVGCRGRRQAASNTH